MSNLYLHFCFYVRSGWITKLRRDLDDLQCRQKNRSARGGRAEGKFLAPRADRDYTSEDRFTSWGPATLQCQPHKARH